MEARQQLQRFPTRVFVASLVLVSALALGFGVGYQTKEVGLFDTSAVVGVPSDAGNSSAALLRQAVSHATSERADMAPASSFWEQAVRHAAAERAELGR